MFLIGYESINFASFKHGIQEWHICLKSFKTVSDTKDRKIWFILLCLRSVFLQTEFLLSWPLGKKKVMQVNQRAGSWGKKTLEP